MYPVTGTVGGDPFTNYGGKRMQFWLPLSGKAALIACDGVQILGSVFGTGIAGDNQQWFKHFAVRSGNKELLSVQVRDATRVSDLRHHPETDEVDVGVEKHTAAAPAVHTGMPLNILNVTAAGHAVSGTGTGSAGAVSYAISRSGAAEAVTVTVRGTQFTLFSSVARKFVGAKAAAFVHVDLKFTKITPTECAGPLPEIWGVHPMSEDTVKLLQPPQHY